MARLLRRPHLVVAFTILALFTLPGAASPPDPAINYDNSASGLVFQRVWPASWRSLCFAIPKRPFRNVCGTRRRPDGVAVAEVH
jgi:hypothetical protein